MVKIIRDDWIGVEIDANVAPRGATPMRVDLDPEFEMPTEAREARTIRYFLWQRPIARVLWTACGLFWSGAGLSLFARALGPFYDNAAAGLLYSVLFPPLVCLYLLVGWLRQEIDRGRIVVESIEPSPNRSVGGWSDPASDPLDARSGALHWRNFHPDDQPN